jgi:hypothetical protein
MPAVVPMAAATAIVAQACRQAADFLTDPQVVGQATIAPGVVVTIYPRRGSRLNTTATLATGNIVAKFRNTGTTAYRRWALPANGESCWQVRWDAAGTLRGRFVAANGSLDTTHTDVGISLHPQPHGRDSAAFRRLAPPGPPPLESHGGLGRSPAASAGLFRFAAWLPARGQGGGFAWTTCLTNGCCEAGF